MALQHCTSAEYAVCNDVRGSSVFQANSTCRWENLAMQRDLDEYDVKILSVLRRNNRLPLDEIAERIHLSPSSVQRRITRLRRTGVIQADVSILAPELLGKRVTALVEVTLESESPDTLQQVCRDMLDEPE